jgi:hypothetical protein
MVSPLTALPNAPLMVTQGVAGLWQLLLSFPVVATYHGPAARADFGVEIVVISINEIIKLTKR